VARLGLRPAILTAGVVLLVATVLPVALRLRRAPAPVEEGAA
jgi:hypothetical protein